ncbi:MAG TPA: hypothetical protein ENH85_08335 [Candidatus Scalindua sp.]|nr:hypothetical protein [Candidatus Scalindua sp.]
MELTSQEFRGQEPGTRAAQVKTYNGEGDLIDIAYILRDDDFDEYLSDAQSVPDGYLTDTTNVKRK